MADLINCKCGKRLKVAEAARGKRVKCPSCNAIIEIPSETTTIKRAQQSKPLPVERIASKDRQRSPQEGGRPNVTPPGEPPQKQRNDSTAATRVVDIARLPNALAMPPEVPCDTEPFLQLLMSEERVVDVDSIDRIREMLLGGLINRNHHTRWIEPYAELKQTRAEWELRRCWRSIGEGLAQEEEPINFLYNAQEIIQERREGECSVVVWSCFAVVIAVILYNWDLSIQVARAKPTMAPGIGDKILEILINSAAENSKFAGLLVKAVIAVVVGCLCMIPAWAAGKVLGKLMAIVAVRRLPKPPDDGFKMSSIAKPPELSDADAAVLALGDFE